MTDELAALRAQVQDLRAAIVKCAARVDRESTGGVLLLRVEIKHLKEALAALQEDVAELVEAREIAKTPAPCWLELDDATRASQFTKLTQWVNDILLAQYPSGKLAECWPNHPEAIWELSTIAAEWHRVYDDPENRNLAAALLWHDKWLPGALARLGQAIRCGDGRCQRVPGVKKWNHS